MSDAATNVAAALTAAQEKKANSTSKPSTKTNSKPSIGNNLPGSRTPAAPARKPITFESAKLLCPCEGTISKVITTFGLDPVNYDAIRETVEEFIGSMANVMSPYMNEKSLEMHLQRVVGAHVGSAHGAGSFYDSKRESARSLSSSLRNELRDEDRPGMDGQANRAARAWEFAATAAIQAYAALAAAHGAVDAYHEVTGQHWKPYASDAQPGRSLDERARNSMAAAFDNT